MKTLLVIDPDAAFHAKVKELLKPGQVELVSTDKGSDAVQLARDVSPDMVILNLELQDLNGFLVCSSLKKNPTTRNIPLVITSGTKTEEDFDQHRKLKFRADSYFRKPLSAKDLSSLLIDFLGADTVRTKKAEPLGADFDEENIDKLLDSTFTAFSTDGSEASMSAEPAEEILEDVDKKKGFNRKLGLKKENVELVPSVDLSDLEEEEEERPLPEEESAPRVDTGDLEPDIEEKPAKKREKTAQEIKTTPEGASEIHELKKTSQQKTVQVITLQKESEFLKTENRNLLMDLTSLKADIADREQELALKKEKIETENEAMKARNLKLEEGIDALQKENQGLKGELELLKTDSEESLAELSRQLLAEEAKLQELEAKYLASEKMVLESGEKENMLMSTIENLTKNTRELEDDLKVNREKLKHLSGILKSAAEEVDSSGS